MFLAQLFSEAGLPDGVLNVINVIKELLILLCNLMQSSISFVGSTPVAKIYEISAKMENVFNL